MILLRIFLGVIRFIAMVTPLIVIGICWPHFLDRHPVPGILIGLALGLTVDHYLKRAFIALGWLLEEPVVFH